MAEIRDFKDLLVWQKAIEISVELFKITKAFPKEEIYGLTSQIRRASVSVAANIAEGNGRNTKGEYIQFLGIAKGSLYELETLIILSKEMNYFTEIQYNSMIVIVTECNKMLKKLIQALKA